MSILENNLVHIRKYNPILAKKIEGHVFDSSISFELATAQSGDPNLIYNGVVLHDAGNPQQEALSVFSQMKSVSNDSVTIIMGLGLGYLFKRAYLSSRGKIVIYEPNLDILRFTLEVVDFSAELGENVQDKPRVYVANNRIELVKCLEDAYSYKTGLNICGLASISKLYSDEINSLKGEMPKICANLESNFATLFSTAFYWAFYGVFNLPYLAESYNIDSLKFKFRNKPAVIVSSGPSLDKSIEYLAKYRDKIIIFCVGNAYRALKKYNIEPDFLTFVDVGITSAQMKDLDTSNTNLIIQSIAHRDFYQLKNKRKFVFYSNNDLFSRWVSKIADFDISEYENKGTVSYLSMYSAFKLGCNPIILAGQDLAYTDNKCYSSGSSYSALKIVKNEESGKLEVAIDNREEFIKHYIPSYFEDQTDKIIQDKLDFINSNMANIKGQNGDNLLTDISYAGFISFFEQFAYGHPEIKLINSSTGGAQIDGFENIPIENILQALPTLNTSVDAVIDESLSNYNEPVKKHSADIKKHLKYMIEDIEKLAPVAQSRLNDSNRLLIELKQHRLNVERIRHLSNNLINDYMKFRELFDNYQVLINCAFKQLWELNRVMESESPSNDGLQDLIDIAKTSKDFYTAFLDEVIRLKEKAQYAYDNL